MSALSSETSGRLTLVAHLILESPTVYRNAAGCGMLMSCVSDAWLNPLQGDACVVWADPHACYGHATYCYLVPQCLYGPHNMLQLYNFSIKKNTFITMQNYHEIIIFAKDKTEFS